jgi:hypothetical protein
LLFGLLAVYVLSAITHGARFESLMCAGKLLAAILCLFALYNSGADIEEIALVSGTVAAVSGILAFCGLPPISGAVSAGRLFGTFQYANAFALYLGVCAFITRASDKRGYPAAPLASLMEAALLLTQSVGGSAVFAAGRLAWGLAQRSDRKPVAPQLAELLLSAICAALMFAIRKYLSPYLAVLPPAALFLPHGKTAGLFAKTKRLSRVAVIAAIPLSLAIAVSLAVLIGIRPFMTYIERLIQITDGARVIFTNPLGIGPGAWAFDVPALQSAFYDARILHSGYIAIGVDAGIAAVILCFASIVFWLRRRPPAKRAIAAGMILCHAAFDISLSFASVTLLLCAIAAGDMRAEKAARVRCRSIWIAPCLLCTALMIPTALKSSAEWTARGGDYNEAIASLESLSFTNDTETALLRMRFSAAAGNNAAFDRAFAELKRPNSDAYHTAAQAFTQRGEYAKAAQMAELCARNSPYFQSGYELMEKMAKLLPPESRAEYLETAAKLKNKALMRIHPLARYIPDDRGIQNNNIKESTNDEKS